MGSRQKRNNDAKFVSRVEDTLFSIAVLTIFSSKIVHLRLKWFRLFSNLRPQRTYSNISICNSMKQFLLCFFINLVSEALLENHKLIIFSLVCEMVCKNNINCFLRFFFLIIYYFFKCIYFQKICSNYFYFNSDL